MTVLPIVGRELRVASRRRGSYIGRVSVALAGLLLGTWMFLLPLPTPRDQGVLLFTGLSVVAFVCCGLAGIFTTADCISTEKREGTLGLLFLTDLRGYDIVLGKLSASSLSVSYAVVALFPILAIPLLLGGVTFLEFIRVVVTALNTLFFSLSLGVFVSCISRDERRSMVCCFVIILFFAAGVPLIAALFEDWGFKRLWKLMLIPSPSYSCFLAFEGPLRRLALVHFRESLIAVHLMAWAFLAFSVFAVRGVWRDKVQATSTGGWRRRWWILNSGPGGALAYRRELLGINAYYWLLARRPWQMRSGWFPLAGAGLLWAWGLAVAPRDWKDPAAYFMTALGLHAIYKLWVATESGRRLAQDRASGALELTLSTPLTLPQITRGHQLALNRQFFGPVLALLVVDFIFLLTDQRDGPWVGTFLAGMVMLLADYFTIVRLGLWMGVCSRSPARASAAIIVRILIFPLVLYGLMWTVLIFFAFYVDHPPIQGMETSTFAIGTYLFFGLTVDAFFYYWATNKIQNCFREAATTRYQQGRKLTQPAR